MHYSLPGILLILLLTSGITALSADGGDSRDSRGSPLTPLLELIEDGQFEQAISELDQALVESPDDADLLNLVAYSHRKLKHYEIALAYYQKALQIDPEHRGANEYLGELYLHLGQLEKAEAQLVILDKSCFFGCKEFDKLEKAIAEFRAKNAS